MSNPFKPKTGEFAENVRNIIGLDDDELRQSFREYGWVQHLPAIADENNVIIAGHRRVRIAGELGIKPVIKTVSFGKGDSADAERFKLAIASNLGHAEMSKKDRQRLAEYLYSQGNLTMAEIAGVLNVAQSTITEDLRNLSTVDKLKHAKTERNPKGAGRPKNKGPKPEPVKFDRKVRDRIASMVLDEGRTFDEAITATGASSTVARVAVAWERGRREAIEHPTIAVDALPMSAKEKLEAAIRQEKKRLQAEHHELVIREADERAQEAIGFILEKARRQERENFDTLMAARKIIKQHRALLSKADYKLIWTCLHPDRVTDPGLKAKYNKAFHVFATLEKLIGEEAPVFTSHVPDMPKNRTEWEELKRKVAEERRAKRKASTHKGALAR